MNAEKPTSETRDNFALWIVVPFLLAIVGTVVMLFTNSANVLKISLVLALWAAAAGVLVATRLRRDRENAERELEAREQRFQAELDAAQARGEADRAALAHARENERPADPGVDTEVLREIQAELARLRAQLEELAGRQFEYEPAALRAEARRVAELERSGGSTKREAPVETPVETPSVKPASGPSTDDTAKIKVVRQPAEKPAETPAQEPAQEPSRPAGAPSFDAIAGRFGGSSRLKDAQNPLSQLISERQAQSAEPAAPAQPSEPSEPSAPSAPSAPSEPSAPAEPAPARAQEQPVTERRGGRRRRDEHGRSSLTVAELLARAQKETD